MRWNEQFVCSALPDVNILYGSFPQEINVSIDSRTLKQGDFFIALHGQQVDGHDYVVDAINKGAAGVLIQRGKERILDLVEKKILNNLLVLSVANPIKALQKLAAAWRAQFSYPVIGVTGSVGKTTTKELLATIFTMSGKKCIASEGNLNSSVGVALSLFKMTSDAQIGVFEMGINSRGEMKDLAAMVKPDSAVITCVGHAHMEGLGTISDIAQEKRAIFSCFKEDNIGVVNGDQQLLAGVGYAHPVVKFGAKTTNQVQARKIVVHENCTQFVLKLYGHKYSVMLPTNHPGAVENALAAASIAHLFDVPHEVILRAIQMPLIVVGRFEKRQLKQKNGIIINDCYNANPESMKAALLALETLSTSGEKVAVLGDMYELGANSAFWHRQLGRFLRKVPSLKRLVLIGKEVEWTKKTVPVNLPVKHVATWEDALAELDKLDKDAIVLVKGSRALGLERLVDAMS